MSERYEKEVSLRLIGDKVECQKYILRARTVLGELYNRDVRIGGNEQAWRRLVLPNGVTITARFTSWMPLLTIEVPPVEPPLKPVGIYQLRMAWDPEGIVLTPVSAEFPDGFGLPTRTAVSEGDGPDDLPAGVIINPAYPEGEEYDPEAPPDTILTSPYGTEGGIQNQVILNKYGNNN